jgi:hypothetical protein
MVKRVKRLSLNLNITDILRYLITNSVIVAVRADPSEIGSEIALLQTNGDGLGGCDS